jgi:TrpR-related protein YerC/YecD
MPQHQFNEEMIRQLYQALVKIDSEETCAQFLQDLCTNKEVEQMAQRLCAARLLYEGKTYNQVIEQTGISSATLSRVSRCIQYGTGYRKVIESEK